MSDYTSSLLSSISEINAELTKIAEAVATKADKDIGNTMEGDLDMNSNDILNATSLNTDSLYIGGQLITPNLVATAELTNAYIPISVYGNTEGGFAAALTALNNTQSILVLDSQNPLILSGDTSYEVEGMTILGTGNHATGEYNKGGAIHINGTTASPLLLGAGARVQGCLFYYPNQNTTATPTVYPPTLLGNNVGEGNGQRAVGFDIIDNTFINSYIAIDTNPFSLLGTSEWIRIQDNDACAISRFVKHTIGYTETPITNNKVSYTYWRESLNQPVREYINQNCVAYELGDVDGMSVVGNYIFGVGTAFLLNDTIAVSIFSSNYVDGTRIGFDFSGATSLGGINIVGCSFNCKDPRSPSFYGCAGMYARWTEELGGQLTVTGCRFEATNGNHVDFEYTGSTGSCFIRATFRSDFYNPGFDDAAGSYQCIRFVDKTWGSNLYVDGTFEDSINGGVNRTAVYIDGPAITRVNGTFVNFDKGVEYANTYPNAFTRHQLSGLCSNVTTEVTDALNTGQVQRGSIYASNTPSQQFFVASAATMELPANTASVLSVSGTTNIDTINGGYLGRVVTLTFAGVLTVNDSTGNLRLAGNFTTSANDTLTLAFDGTNWREISRSTN